MKITIHEARERLAKAGIELGHTYQLNDARRTKRYEVTTPLGTKIHMQAYEIAGILQELEKPALQI